MKKFLFHDVFYVADGQPGYQSLVTTREWATAAASLVATTTIGQSNGCYEQPGGQNFQTTQETL